jgi:hypothetical protein
MNLFKILSILSLTIVSTVYAAKDIHVGIYDFPPFANTKQEQNSGLTFDIIKYINKSQD